MDYCPNGLSEILKMEIILSCQLINQWVVSLPTQVVAEPRLACICTWCRGNKQDSLLYRFSGPMIQPGKWNCFCQSELSGRNHGAIWNNPRLNTVRKIKQDFISRNQKGRRDLCWFKPASAATLNHFRKANPLSSDRVSPSLHHSGHNSLSLTPSS